MKNWLRQRLLNFLVDAGEEQSLPHSDRLSRTGTRIPVSLRECDIDDSPDGIQLPDPINFKVQQVNGGTLIETRWYDYKKDESRVKLHIVTPDEHLSESIGKIVTMELLQK
jgi:hypothetical protein